MSEGTGSQRDPRGERAEPLVSNVDALKTLIVEALSLKVD